MTDIRTSSVGPEDEALEIIAFVLRDQRFAVRTTSIREIRGWAPVMPLPHAPSEMLGVMNLRGTVIPIIDMSIKLGMRPTQATERSAIVVADIHDKTVGMMVDRVSDILTISTADLQPIPTAAGSYASAYAEGIFAREKDMVCFLDLDTIFGPGEADPSALTA